MEILNICPNEDMHKNVFDNAIHNSQSLENNPMSIYGRMDK